MQVTTKKVASRIKQNRIEAELTQQELADFAGVDRKTINRIENGHFSPNIETLLRISTALGVKPESMFASAYWKRFLYYLSCGCSSYEGHPLLGCIVPDKSLGFKS